MTLHALSDPSFRTLSWGPWSLHLRGDELADISYAGRRVLKGIRAVVRNHNWLTLTPVVDSAGVRESEDGLAVALNVEWTGFGARYSGQLEVGINGDGLTVAFHGTARQALLSNRIGLVVLHPADDAGRPVVVGHPDGSRTDAVFPTWISPHQPFQDIARMSWNEAGTTFELSFAGDVFETEDQRNWTDASFKTYSTPLSRPFPLRHEAGSRVEQAVTLRAREAVQVHDEALGWVVPEIGFWYDAPASLGSGGLPGPLVLDIAANPARGDGTVSIAEAAKAAVNAPRGLDVRIVAAKASEACEVLDGLPAEKILRLTAFDPTTHVSDPLILRLLAAHAHRQGYRGVVLEGVRSHFTELNRNAHLISGAFDGTVYSVTSQMHAVEPQSVMDTLGMQPLTAAQASRIGGGQQLHIGPITIAPRFNAVATEGPGDDELPQPSRLATEPFAAAWALGSVAALTLPGVASLAYGIPADPEAPVTRVLSDLAALRGAQVLASSGSASGPTVYPVRQGERITCFLANTHPWPLHIRLAGPGDALRDVTVPGWDTRTVAFD